jgi:putative membrane protein
MTLRVLVAFAHHLAAFVLFAALFMELVLIKGELTLWSARKIVLYDLIYGIAAGVVIAAGLLRVVYFEKGVHYYVHSAAFLAKIALLALVGLLSIYPTREFLSWRARLRRGELPALEALKRRRIATTIHAELTGVALVILCAVLMARGVGYFGR